MMEPALSISETLPVSKKVNFITRLDSYPISAPVQHFGFKVN